MLDVISTSKLCGCVLATPDRTVVPASRRCVSDANGRHLGTADANCPECRGTGYLPDVPAAPGHALWDCPESGLDGCGPPGDPASLVIEQAPPVPNGRRPVWEIVIERDEAARRVIERKGGGEIARPDWDAYLRHCRERDAEGRRKYSTPLQSHNGRDPLVDALQEALDLRVYMEQAYVESGEDEALRDLPTRMVADEARYLALRVERLILRRGQTKDQPSKQEPT